MLGNNRQLNISIQQLVFIATFLLVFFQFKVSVRGLSLPTYIEDAVVVIEDGIFIDGQVKYSVHGTGFIVQDTSKHMALLVTNRHVLQNRDSIFVRFNTLDGKSERRVYILKRKDGSFSWRAHPDANIDVAAIAVPQDLNVRAIDTDRFKPISEVSLGDEVFFVGFPLVGFAGKDKNYPIIRHGVVSYISKEDVFSDKNIGSVVFSRDMILIDATSLSGNSGSPVISIPRKGSNRTSLIGIIQGHLSDPNTNENFDLGIVIPVDRISEITSSFK